MKCPIPNVKIDQKTWVHLKLVGPYSQGPDVLLWIDGMCGTVIRSGPYTDNTMHPKVDMERFLILAHVPVEEEYTECQES